MRFWYPIPSKTRYSQDIEIGDRKSRKFQYDPKMVYVLKCSPGNVLINLIYSLTAAY